jgi:hypothetical protein
VQRAASEDDHAAAVGAARMAPASKGPRIRRPGGPPVCYGKDVNPNAHSYVAVEEEIRSNRW